MLQVIVDNEIPDTPESREMVRQFTQKRAQRTKELEQINKMIENNQKLRNQMSSNDHKMQEQIAVSSLYIAVYRNHSKRKMDSVTSFH